MKGRSDPTVFEDTIVRPRDPIQLLDKLAVVTTNPYYSDAVPCGAFRKFDLRLFIDSTSNPTTVRFVVQFYDPWSGQWYDYNEGLFGTLYWEDGDTASGVYECFHGDVAGREMRIKVVGVGTTSSAYFTVSAAVDFNN